MHRDSRFLEVGHLRQPAYGDLLQHFHYNQNFFKCKSFFIFFWQQGVSLFKGRSPKDRGIFLLLYLGCFAPKPQTRLFPQLSWKSRGKRALSKNFSVILSVCWFTCENGESLHPIPFDSFSIFLSVISTQSDKWKIFRLFRAVFLFLLKIIWFWLIVQYNGIAKFILTRESIQFLSWIMKTIGIIASFIFDWGFIVNWKISLAT